MEIPFYQIDAFTGKCFGGNPAAVCPLPEWLDDTLLQSIAAENNLSETAFFVPKDGDFELRWFTPTVEVDLCGHATLAAAFVLFNFLDYRLPEIVFHSRSGRLLVSQSDDLIYLNFPATPAAPVRLPPELVKGLGKSPREVFKSRDYLAVFETEGDILELRPDFQALSQLDSLGVIVTATGEPADFVSRFFAPRAGVPEDPVTGSAHTTLVPYWAARLGKKKLHARQVSSRGGELFCEDFGERVSIAGKAVKFAEGKIFI